VSHGGNSAVNTNVVTADASYTTAGIWLLASRINHSCVGNCRRAFIGDMQLVRATCDIPAGTELLFAYRSPKPLETYAETQEALKDWGFTCGCALCLARKATTAATLQRRMMLRRDIDAALGDPNRKGFRADNFAKIKQYFKKFELTYHKAEEAAGRQDLCETYFALGAALLSINQPGNAIETIVKGLAALGFVIQTYPSVGGGDKVPRVEVQRWGVANDFVTWAFIHLHKAYKMVAPELCDAVKPYIVNAYCMMVGEPKSASDTVLVLM
jgi:hypothetical protein